MKLIYSSKNYSRVPFSEFTIVLIVLASTSCYLTDSADTIETIVYTDDNGIEHEEYAFIAPMRGYPEHVLKMFCANVKLRLYWNMYREEIKLNLRKGLYLRRVARFAHYAFDDIRNADSPFEAPRLSRIDDYFDLEGDDPKAANTTDTVDGDEPRVRRRDSMLNKLSFTKKSHTRDQAPIESEKMTERKLTDITQEIVETSKIEKPSTIEYLKSFIQKYAPKVGMALYTRIRTMWWLMYPCVFTKYYLWDTALDEFMKLKRSLVMYPDIQLVKLQDIDCLSTKLFKRILDACKILNPLMNFSFGQLDLNSLTTRGREDKL